MQQHDEPNLASIDTSKPSIARMYDYYLGGKDNFQVDRDTADQVLQVLPEVRQLVRINRAFVRRVVRYLVHQGVRQFIDIGSGLPTVGNVHEIAQEIAPDARVVYVDSDPVVQAFGRALLATNANTTVASADMRSPAEVLGHPETLRLIDFSEPVGVLMIAMIHFLTDEEYPAILRRLRDAMAPGSYLAVTHSTNEGQPPEVVARVEAIYAGTPTPVHARDHAEITRFFDGFEFVEPGLVTLDQWRPDPGDPAAPVSQGGYGGVGRKY